MRKFLYHLFILVGLFFSSLSHAQIVLEALEKPTGCSAIPSFHPFHKVTRGNYKWDGTFADPYTGEGSAYMMWETAQNYNFPAGYHLPTVAEWMTITPSDDVWEWSNNSTIVNQVEKHQFGKTGQPTTQYKTFKGDYYKGADGTLYGIRFKPSEQTIGQFTPHTTNAYTTAYRYRRLGDRMEIDMKYIGDSALSLDDIKNNNFWDETACIGAVVLLYRGLWETSYGYPYWINEANFVHIHDRQWGYFLLADPYFNTPSAGYTYGAGWSVTSLWAYWWNENDYYLQVAEFFDSLVYNKMTVRLFKD